MNFLHFEYFFFVLTYMCVSFCHNKTSYGSFFHSTIGGPFFLLSVFTGAVQTLSAVY